MNAIFQNLNYTELAQLIVSFCLGVLLAPWSLGALFYIIFLIIYEIFCGCISRLKEPYWRLEMRVGIVFSSLFGFIVGRILIGYHDPFT